MKRWQKIYLSSVSLFSSFSLIFSLEEGFPSNSLLIAAALSRSFLKAENVSIVNIGSVVGLMGNSSQISYAASKAGLIGFTKSLAKELGSRNVRCNAVCPGFIETEMTDKLDDKKKEAYLTEIPINRIGTTREVANLDCYMLSQSSS